MRSGRSGALVRPRTPAVKERETGSDNKSRTDFKKDGIAERAGGREGFDVAFFVVDDVYRVPFDSTVVVVADFVLFAVKSLKFSLSCSIFRITW